MKFQEFQNVSDDLNEEVRCWLECRTVGLVSELRKADQIKLQVWWAAKDKVSAIVGDHSPQACVQYAGVL